MIAEELLQFGDQRRRVLLPRVDLRQHELGKGEMPDIESLGLLQVSLGGLDLSRAKDNSAPSWE